MFLLSLIFMMLLVIFVISHLFVTILIIIIESLSVMFYLVVKLYSQLFMDHLGKKTTFIKFYTRIEFLTFSKTS